MVSLPEARFLSGDEELAVAARHVRERLPSGLTRGRDVVGRAEGHAAGIAVGDAHPVDLRRAAAVRREVDRAAVGREHRLGVDAARLGQPPGLAAVGADQVDLRPAVARQGDCQLRCRPATRPARCCCRGTRPPPCAGRSRGCAHRRPACGPRTTRRRGGCRPATRRAR